MKEEAEKQVVRVLRAVEEGCSSSDEISALTGLPLPVVSNYLTELRRDGMIRLTHRACRRIGRPMNRYAPVRP